MNDKKKKEKPKQDIPTILSRIQRPKKAVVTAGMPYANGPLHLGHLAGAHLPADIYSRWLKLLIGHENVLYVCGSDDHGTAGELAAKKGGVDTKDYIEKIRSEQKNVMDQYSIGLDVYTGTSAPENYETHKTYCQDFLRNLHKNNMLEKKTSKQWFDTELNIFLADRFVQGQCPNEKCGSLDAFSDECDTCGAKFEPEDLINPKSKVSSATPELRDTDHWYLDMWKVTDQFIEWLSSKQRTWRKLIMTEVMGTVLPCVQFPHVLEEKFKAVKERLPKHKSRYGAGKKIVVQFNNLNDLEVGKKTLEENDIKNELLDGWAHRAITRDVSWGIPVPTDIEEGMDNKTLYVWPESLIAPISFTKLALKNKGLDPETYKEFWCDPEAKVYQFLGIDNVFFYVLMQGAMWFGTQKNPLRLPEDGELQLTEVFACYHLHANGEKMSKSKGNFFMAEELMSKYNFTPEQVRYYLAILSLSEKSSNFDFEDLKRRNDFLAGPLNAAFEKPISACHSKFSGVVQKGNLIGKTEKETLKIVQTYTRFMEKGEYAKALFALENYARIINGLFVQFKPHDDRHDEQERIDALYSSFYILQNIIIMLWPVVPETMERLRKSLNLPESIYSIDNLGKDFPDNHRIGEQTEYFPSTT